MAHVNRKKGGHRVEVQDGQFEKAFRKFRNKVQDSGLLQELKERMEYEKPSIARKKAKNQARKRWLRKQAANKLPERQY